MAHGSSRDHQEHSDRALEVPAAESTGRSPEELGGVDIVPEAMALHEGHNRSALLLVWVEVT
eukprot:7017201-Prymnesium_polylepis.1